MRFPLKRMSADCKLQLVLTLTPIPNKSTSLVHVLIKIDEGFLEEWDINKKIPHYQYQ
jgi:hypothetical protein